MADTVRAAVLVGPRRFEVREFPKPKIGQDDGLLRLERCGICGSDVEQYRNEAGRERPPGGGGSWGGGPAARPPRGPGGAPPPAPPGGEPLGVIEEVGERAAQR